MHENCVDWIVVRKYIIKIVYLLLNIADFYVVISFYIKRVRDSVNFLKSSKQTTVYSYC